MSNPNRKSAFPVDFFQIAAKTIRSPLALLTALTLPLLTVSVVQAQSSTAYQQTNIVSDGFVQAQTTDPNLVNPWGVAPGAAFWIDAQGSGMALADDAGGNKQLSVTIPSASGGSTKGLPSGIALNSSTSSFMLSDGAAANYLFATLDGTVSGWNSGGGSNPPYNPSSKGYARSDAASSNPAATIVINNSSAGAVYTDLAILTSGGNTDLLLANFGQGKVEVYDQAFKTTTLSGNFTDPDLPANFVPYAIHVFNNLIYVTYAEKDQITHREALGVGNGLVDVYDANGNFVRQAIAHGNLNAPWGMTIAPSSFGTFGGDLLVGNFGDGVINVYNASTYAFVGQVKDGTGNVIANPGLWEILFVNSSLADPNKLYFSAGLNQSRDGLFASIAAVAPAGAAGFQFTTAATSMTLQPGQSGTASLDLAPANGFSGTVTFACSGLPSGVTCSFSPSSVMLSGGTSASTILTVSTTGAATGTVPYDRQARLMGNRSGAGLISLAPTFLLPIGMAGTLFGRGKPRKPYARALFLVVLFIGAIGMVAGCGYNKMNNSYTAPAPTATMSAVTVTATSGAMSESVKFTLTVQ